MASLAFSRLGWSELVRAFALADSDLATQITLLLARDRSAYPRWDLPHPVSRRVVEERARLDMRQREREFAPTPGGSR
jgi:hypothetical protein